MHHYKRGLTDGPLRSFLATMLGSSNGEEIARGGNREQREGEHEASHIVTTRRHDVSTCLTTCVVP